MSLMANYFKAFPSCDFGEDFKGCFHDEEENVWFVSPTWCHFRSCVHKELVDNREIQVLDLKRVDRLFFENDASRPIIYPDLPDRYRDKIELGHVNHARKKDDCTALMYAAYLGDVRGLRKLILSRANLDLAQKDGNTALMEAVWRNNSECVRILLSSGAKVSIQNKRGQNAVTLAAFTGSLEIMELLLQFASIGDVNHRTTLGHTPLMVAAYCGHIDSVHMLVTKANVDFRQEDERHMTALCWAHLFCRPIAVYLCLQAAAQGVLARIVERRIKHFKAAMKSEPLDRVLLNLFMQHLSVFTMIPVARHVIVEKRALEFLTTNSEVQRSIHSAITNLEAIMGARLDHWLRLLICGMLFYESPPIEQFIECGAGQWFLNTFETLKAVGKVTNNMEVTFLVVASYDWGRAWLQRKAFPLEHSLQFIIDHARQTRRKETVMKLNAFLESDVGCNLKKVKQLIGTEHLRMVCPNPPRDVKVMIAESSCIMYEFAERAMRYLKEETTTELFQQNDDGQSLCAELSRRQRRKLNRRRRTLINVNPDDFATKTHVPAVPPPATNKERVTVVEQKDVDCLEPEQHENVSKKNTITGIHCQASSCSVVSHTEQETMQLAAEGHEPYQLSDCNFRHDQLSNNINKSDPVSYADAQTVHLSENDTKSDQLSNTDTQGDQLSSTNTQSNQLSNADPESDQLSHTDTKCDTLPHNDTKADHLSDSDAKTILSQNQNTHLTIKESVTTFPATETQEGTTLTPEVSINASSVDGVCVKTIVREPQDDHVIAGPCIIKPELQNGYAIAGAVVVKPEFDDDSQIACASVDKLELQNDCPFLGTCVAKSEPQNNNPVARTCAVKLEQQKDHPSTGTCIVQSELQNDCQLSKLLRNMTSKDTDTQAIRALKPLDLAGEKSSSQAIKREDIGRYISSDDSNATKPGKDVVETPPANDESIQNNFSNLSVKHHQNIQNKRCTVVCPDNQIVTINDTVQVTGQNNEKFLSCESTPISLVQKDKGDHVPFSVLISNMIKSGECYIKPRNVVHYPAHILGAPIEISSKKEDESIHDNINLFEAKYQQLRQKSSQCGYNLKSGSLSSAQLNAIEFPEDENGKQLQMLKSEAMSQMEPQFGRKLREKDTETSRSQHQFQSHGGTKNESAAVRAIKIPVQQKRSPHSSGTKHSSNGTVYHCLTDQDYKRQVKKKSIESSEQKVECNEQTDDSTISKPQIIPTVAEKTRNKRPDQTGTPGNKQKKGSNILAESSVSRASTRVSDTIQSHPREILDVPGSLQNDILTCKAAGCYSEGHTSGLQKEPKNTKRTEIAINNNSRTLSGTNNKKEIKNVQCVSDISDTGLQEEPKNTKRTEIAMNNNSRTLSGTNNKKEIKNVQCVSDISDTGLQEEPKNTKRTEIAINNNSRTLSGTNNKKEIKNVQCVSDISDTGLQEEPKNTKRTEIAINNNSRTLSGTNNKKEIKNVQCVSDISDTNSEKEIKNYNCTNYIQTNPLIQHSYPAHLGNKSDKFIECEHSAEEKGKDPPKLCEDLDKCGKKSDGHGSDFSTSNLHDGQIMTNQKLSNLAYKTTSHVPAKFQPMQHDKNCHKRQVGEFSDMNQQAAYLVSANICLPSSKQQCDSKRSDQQIDQSNQKQHSMTAQETKTPVVANNTKISGKAKASKVANLNVKNPVPDKRPRSDKNGLKSRNSLGIPSTTTDQKNKKPTGQSTENTEFLPKTSNVDNLMKHTTTTTTITTTTTTTITASSSGRKLVGNLPSIRLGNEKTVMAKRQIMSNTSKMHNPGKKQTSLSVKSPVQKPTKTNSRVPHRTYIGLDNNAKGSTVSMLGDRCKEKQKGKADMKPLQTETSSDTTNCEKADELPLRQSKPPNSNKIKVSNKSYVSKPLEKPVAVQEIKPVVHVNPRLPLLDACTSPEHNPNNTSGHEHSDRLASRLVNCAKHSQQDECVLLQENHFVVKDNSTSLPQKSKVNLGDFGQDGSPGTHPQNSDNDDLTTSPESSTFPTQRKISKQIEDNHDQTPVSASKDGMYGSKNRPYIEESKIGGPSIQSVSNTHAKKAFILCSAAGTDFPPFEISSLTGSEKKPESPSLACRSQIFEHRHTRNNPSVPMFDHAVERTQDRGQHGLNSNGSEQSCLNSVLQDINNACERSMLVERTETTDRELSAAQSAEVESSIKPRLPNKVDTNEQANQADKALATDVTPKSKASSRGKQDHSWAINKRENRKTLTIAVSPRAASATASTEAMGVSEKRHENTNRGSLAPHPRQKQEHSVHHVKGDKKSCEKLSKLKWISTSLRWRSLFEKLVMLNPSRLQKLGYFYACFDDDELHIGKGSHGTILTVGLTECGEEVAVKRVLKSNLHIFQNELAILNLNHLKHGNIIQLKCYHEDEKFCYLVEQLCDYTLKEYVAKLKAKGELEKQAWRLVRQLLSGLQALHSAGVLHMDLKPQNVLLDSDDNVRIADFGASRQLESGSSTTYLNTTVGTRCWRPKESLDPRKPGVKVGYRAVSDIQVAGMLVYYIVTGGKHPYGDNPETCDINIRNMRPQLHYVSDDVLLSLLNWMIHPNMDRRRSANQCLRHPYLWQDTYKLEFLLCVSRQVEEVSGSRSDVLEQINSSGLWSGYNHWTTQVDCSIVEKVVPNFVYSNSVVDLLHYIRHVTENFDNLSASDRHHMGTPHQYFCHKFPRLLMPVYEILQDSDWCKQTDLKSFYPSQTK